VERDTEEDNFAPQDGRRPRKGPLFGGSPLTVETGSDFPIGITRAVFENQKLGDLSGFGRGRPVFSKTNVWERGSTI